ncbi:MAG: putative 6-oxopurine nucleoside phosphorylase [Methanosaeta sp. PtaB.Bin039]|nr:MAG: putative 6-oxopurine nucleoside phosphorylase [Methanosaeta sp. PtaB.Bin039]OPY46785.1 MAG: putative 6-oxopurine nucleoside phosphorylase [Methanosaeta sp. PtaU1.Bin028]
MTPPQIAEIDSTSHSAPLVAILGRVDLGVNGDMETIETPYGQVEAVMSSLGGVPILLISRHGKDRLPPHRVNYRALVAAAALAKARRLISVNTVGSMSPIPGSFFLPDDFVEFTKARPNTFFEDRATHVGMSRPYCPQIQEALGHGLEKAGAAASRGVYVCTEGPHLETPAQIRMLSQYGDVVGMTGYPEVVLAREMCLCYASLCLITNQASGLAEGPLSARDVGETTERLAPVIRQILEEAIVRLPVERRCSCHRALDDAHI